MSESASNTRQTNVRFSRMPVSASDKCLILGHQTVWIRQQADRRLYLKQTAGWVIETLSTCIYINPNHSVEYVDSAATTLVIAKPIAFSNEALKLNEYTLSSYHLMKDRSINSPV